jgi:PhnB protein
MSDVDEPNASIAPWLRVGDATRAVGFYRDAFGATELERLDLEGVVQVAQLSIDGADFWVQHDPESYEQNARGTPTVRMIVSLADPDTALAQAVAAGAVEVAAMHEEHGWRIGRVRDPFGHHWELGKRT